MFIVKYNNKIFHNMAITVYFMCKRSKKWNFTSIFGTYGRTGM